MKSNSCICSPFSLASTGNFGHARGRKFDDIVFASSKTDPSIGAIEIKYKGDYSYEDLWSKHRETCDMFMRLTRTSMSGSSRLMMTHMSSWRIFDTFLAGSQAIQDQNEQGILLHISHPIAMHIDDDGVHDGNRTVDGEVLAQFLEKTNYKFIFDVRGAGMQ